jgi:hypothetical protein
MSCVSASGFRRRERAATPARTSLSGAVGKNLESKCAARTIRRGASLSNVKMRLVNSRSPYGVESVKRSWNGEVVVSICEATWPTEAEGEPAYRLDIPGEVGEDVGQVLLHKEAGRYEQISP